MDGPQTTPRIVLRDEAHGKWLEFISPCRIITTRQIQEVIPLLRRIEDASRREGLYAAGFISYEAAPAFDPALPVRVDGEFPLIWFGLFDQASEINLPENAEQSVSSLSWHSSVTVTEYQRCLSEIRKFIREGDTYQVNFTYRLQAKMVSR